VPALLGLRKVVVEKRFNHAQKDLKVPLVIKEAVLTTQSAMGMPAEHLKPNTRKQRKATRKVERHLSTQADIVGMRNRMARTSIVTLRDNVLTQPEDRLPHNMRDPHHDTHENASREYWAAHNKAVHKTGKDRRVSKAIGEEFDHLNHEIHHLTHISEQAKEHGHLGAKHKSKIDKHEAKTSRLGQRLSELSNLQRVADYRRANISPTVSIPQVAGSVLRRTAVKGGQKLQASYLSASQRVTKLGNSIDNSIENRAIQASQMRVNRLTARAAAARTKSRQAYDQHDQNQRDPNAVTNPKLLKTATKQSAKHARLATAAQHKTSALNAQLSRRATRHPAPVITPTANWLPPIVTLHPTTVTPPAPINPNQVSDPRVLRENAMNDLVARVDANPELRSIFNDMLSWVGKDPHYTSGRDSRLQQAHANGASNDELADISEEYKWKAFSEAYSLAEAHLAAPAAPNTPNVPTGAEEAKVKRALRDQDIREIELAITLDPTLRDEFAKASDAMIAAGSDTMLRWQADKNAALAQGATKEEIDDLAANFRLEVMEDALLMAKIKLRQSAAKQTSKP
jgi:hypothetical protein